LGLIKGAPYNFGLIKGAPYNFYKTDLDQGEMKILFFYSDHFLEKYTFLNKKA
jgi:hypothetical protein